MIVGVVGSGAMGSGIAQVAAMAGEEVRLFDKSIEAGAQAIRNIQHSVNKLVEKGKLSPPEGVAAMGRIYLCGHLETFAECDLVIEAVIEDITVKKELFAALENMVSASCVLATNTSSLSVASIAASLNQPEKCIGIHFFNPPYLMRLVEVIPAIRTNQEITLKIRNLIESWGKVVVIARDTPGFIVNKVARPYYGEAIRILEEGIADIFTIDQAMTSHGFKMGPFTLMDFIGHDVNYRVTESVWKSFFFDSRYKPSLTQLRLVEAGYLGRKSGKGFYNYTDKVESEPIVKTDLLESIFMRIISMLINEAADTVGQQICSVKDVETAVKLGVNYPKGLLEWGKDLGYDNIVRTLDDLFDAYHEERYRVCRYLRNLAKI
jgi:3-hydroxybutyryl-CoA dehydrogenase